MKKYPDQDYTEQELAMFRQKRRDERDRAIEEERQRVWEVHRALEVLRNAT